MSQELDIELVFRQYFDQMVLLAIGYLKDTDEASDVVMSIFERLISNKSKLEDLNNASEVEIKNYLLLVTKHRCLDQLKVNKNRLVIQSYLSLGWLRADRNRAIDVFEEEAIQALKKILAPQEARILNLYVEGYSYEEISQALSISIFTVRNTLVNARNKIRKVWDIFLS